MALRTLIANDRLKEIDERMNIINSELEELKELETTIQEDYLENRDKSDSVEELYNRSKEMDSKKEELSSEKTNLVAERLKLEAELSSYGEGEEVKDMEIKNDSAVEQRNALNLYLHKKDIAKEEVRAAGLVSDDAEVLIPEEIIYQPRDEVYTEQDLEQYINQVSVSTPTGKYPIMLRTQEKMHTVAELNANPRLKNPEFKQVTWSVDTYRGYIPISQEALDDSAVDLVALVSRHILRIVLNTTNSLVAPLIKEYQPAIAKNLDDLKKLDELMLDPAYQRAFYMSRTMYFYLDTLKDSHGDYVLQPDVTSPSGKVLFGIPIVRINDNLIGDYNGEMCCFFGDLKAAITKFNRKTISAMWDDHDLYDTNIQSGFRAGYAICDDKAGYYVLFAPVERDVVIKTSDEQTPETVEGVEATIAVENNVATIKYTGLTDQVITYSLKDSKGAVVAEMKGRFTTEKTEDTITVTFAQDMVMGDYTLEAKVLDQKKYKCIKSVKLNLKQRSEEAAKILNGTPIVIAND